MSKLEDLENIEDKLEDLFARIGPQIHMKNNKCSTYKVFTELDNLILELKLESITSSYAEKKEFLFDFCWKKKKMVISSISLLFVNVSGVALVI